MKTAQIKIFAFFFQLPYDFVKIKQLFMKYLIINKPGFFSRKFPKAYLHNFSTLNDKLCTEADRFDQNPSDIN